MNINVHNLESPHIIATNIWKYFYAVQQNESFPNKPNYEINFKDDLVVGDDINILHVGFNAIGYLSISHIKKFDIIVIDNNVDHAQVHDERIMEFITKYDNVYFLIGGFVSSDYHLHHKIISYPADWIDCIQLYSDPLCFTRYSIDTTKHKHGIKFIGGALRSWRKFIIDQLPNIEMHQISTDIAGTKHVIGGSKYDKPFIDMCNKMYGVLDDVTPDNEFYGHLTLGLEHLPAGGARLGYYALRDYSEKQCIIYPEACFVNHHVFPTEKLWKCVASMTHWIMFAGSESYEILKQYNIRSILELTPNGIHFDKIDNHEMRFREQVKSISYLNEHPDIFNSSEAIDILNNNYNAFFNNHHLIYQLTDKIESIIKQS